MAGGAGDPGLTDSILEVPTYVIALVFLFFLILSILFEKGVHWLSHKFEEWGRVGLVEALGKLVMELTLLGFISLLLLTFQSALSKFCVGYSTASTDWTLMNNIEGCPCCLSRTQGISTCAQIEHGCLYNVSNHFSPYCDCDEPPEDAADECYPYGGAELVYFISQLAPTVALTSKVVHATMPNVTLDQMCGLYCCVANNTWDSEGISVNPSNLESCGLSLGESAAPGRRLLRQGSSAAGAGALGGAWSPLLLLEGEAVWEGSGLFRGPLQPSHQQQQQRQWQQRQQWEVRRQGASLRRRLQGQEAEAQNLSGEEAEIADALNDIIEAHGGQHSGGSSSGRQDNESHNHIVPKAKAFKCTGPFFAGSCHDGQVPAISNASMHQIHLWVFLISICHVVTSVIMIVLAHFRLRQWRKWQVVQCQEEKEAFSEEVSDSDAALAPHSPGQPGSDQSHFPVGKALEDGKGIPLSGAPPADEANGEQNLEAGPLAKVTPTEPASDSHSPEQPGSDQSHLPASKALEDGKGMPHPGAPLADEANGEHNLEAGPLAEATPTEPSSGEELGDSGRVGVDIDGAALPSFGTADGEGGPRQLRQLSRQATLATSSWRRLQRRWVRRSTLVRRKRELAFEYLTVLVQAFLPNIVRHHEFLMIRSGYIACTDPEELPAGASGGAAAQPFDFVQHMLMCLEHDAARVVGISVEMWLVVIVWVLLSGIGNWAGQIFLWGTAALLLAVNLALVVMLRYACRGSDPTLMRRERRMFAWLRAELLLIPIRMILFLCSLVYSTDIFFAWQFGGQSCYFEGEGDLWTTVNGLPWWTSLIFVTVVLLFVSFVTVPAYSLAVHATREEEVEAEKVLLTPLARTLLRQISLAHQASQQRNQEELGALQAENQRLKKMLSGATSAASGAVRVEEQQE